jgi:hypothetical protein
MYLRIKSNEFTEKMLSKVSSITDYARLHPVEATYDKDSGTMTLPLIRFPILKAGAIRKGYWGRILDYKI